MVTIYYWPSSQSKLPGGKGVGHISVLFRDGTYLSHVPDLTGNATRMGVRKSIPGSSLKDVIIYRRPSVRFRTLANDESLFGKDQYSLLLPEVFIEEKMKEAAKNELLVTAPNEPPLQGPLPYYQLADSEEGRGDRSQCTTTTARVVAKGLPMSMQHQIKTILEQYMPDSLWEALNQLVD
jgi:hypothetical protein